tara:strand:+ start:1245 stop:3383 length:2139 start_codon:yes stop_codon:yes gene_type:complete
MATVIYEFELPNGTILEIEGEEGKQAEAELQAKKYISENTPKELTLKDRAKDYGMSLASGITKGATYLAGFPGDLDELGKQYLPKWMHTPIAAAKYTANPLHAAYNIYQEKEPLYLPSSKAIMDYAEQKVPQIKPVTQYEPQTNLGRYTQTMAEFATPGLAGKTSAARKVGTGLGSFGGLMYQGTEDLTGSPGAAVGVSIPSMLLAALFARPTTGAKLAKDALEGVPSKEIQAAKALEETGQELGVNLMPGEVFDNKNIRNLTRDVVSSEKGSPIIYGAAMNRRNEVMDVAQTQADAIADAPKSQREVYDLITDTAKSSIKQVKKIRTSESRKAGYGVANNEVLEPNQVLNIISKIDDAIAATNNTKNKASLTKIKNELIKKKIKIKGQKKKEIIPETNINKLDSTFKIYRDNYRSSQQGKNTDLFINQDLGIKLFNKTDDGILDSLNAELRTNANYAKANDTFARLSDEIVAVVENNIEPLIKGGLTPAKIKSFIFDPKTASVADVNKTFEILNKTNPEATIQLANTYFRNALNQSFKMTKQGDDLTQGFKLIDSIAGTGEQRKIFMAVIDNVAKAKGVNANELKVGFEKMINVLERTGRVANLNNPGFDFGGKASRAFVKDIAMMKTFNPLVRLATKWGEFKAGRAWEELANVFTQDNSVEALVQLSKINPDSKRAIVRVVQIIDGVQGIKPMLLTESDERQLITEEQLK